MRDSVWWVVYFGTKKETPPKTSPVVVPVGGGREKTPRSVALSTSPVIQLPMKYNACRPPHQLASATVFHSNGSLKQPPARRGTSRSAKTARTSVSVQRLVPLVRARCMLAPPYVAMKCSVTSERGQPTLSPLTMGVRMPLIFEMVTRRLLNSA